MCVQPSMPMAPPITVPSVQNAMVRTPFTVPAAESTPERSRSCSSWMLSSSKKLLRRNNGSRGSSDSPTASRAMSVIAGLLFQVMLGLIRPGLIPPEGDRHVVTAESERVVDRVPVITVPRLTRHHVQIDLWIEVFKIECRRDQLIPQCEHSQDRLYRADRTDRVAEGGLGRIHRRLVAAEGVVDGLAFGQVADLGAGGVGIDVVDVVRDET